ncbi:MAG: cobalamin B12-binding domain-containing protein [Candidatus Woesearchaeota archaeon]
MKDLLNDILKAALLYETYDMTPEDKSYLKDYEDILKNGRLNALKGELREAFHVCDEKKAKSLIEDALDKHSIRDVCRIIILLIEETERTAYGPSVFRFGIKTWVLSYVIKDYEIMRYLYHEVLENRLKPWKKKKLAVAVVEPDMHEYGALYGEIILKLAGYEIINLGYNLPVKKVLSEVKSKKIDVLILTSILSDPYDNMENIIKRLKRSKTKVIISGTMPWEIVKQMKADGYINCLALGPKVVDHLTGVRKYTEQEVPILYD